MIFTETNVEGAFLLDVEKIEDERGFFARSWSGREIEAHHLNPRMVECNISFNKKKGTLRGMHYQAEPHAQAKLVRCTKGALYDAIVDLRPRSSSFKKWAAVELTADNHRMLYVPEGCAHGFQTLQDDTEIFYQMSAYYHPESARGVRWNDPAFSIEWPEDERIILLRDQNYQDFLA